MNTYIVSSYCEMDQTLRIVHIVDLRGGGYVTIQSGRQLPTFQNFGNKPDYTVTEPRNPKCESSLSWKHPVSYLKMCYVRDLIIATGNINLMNTAEILCPFCFHLTLSLLRTEQFCHIVAVFYGWTCFTKYTYIQIYMNTLFNEILQQ